MAAGAGRMSTRHQHRRRQRKQNRKCLTVADQQRLNNQVRLPDDHPTVKRLDPNLSGSQRCRIVEGVTLIPYSDIDEIVVLLRSSCEAAALVDELRDHPGPESVIHPLVLLTAVLHQAVKKGKYLRTEICERINRFDTRFWHEHGMCDNKQRIPVSYTSTYRQLVRLEELLRVDEDDLSSVFDRLSSDLLKLSIPETRRESATALSVDQTAFPTFYRTTNYGSQDAVNKAFKETGKAPEGCHVGEDGKLVRCKDTDARAGHRSASTTAGNAGFYTGYAVSSSVLVRSTKWSGRPKANPLVEGTEIPPYIAGLNVDPASAHPGKVCVQATLKAIGIAAGIGDVIADRGITNSGEAFNRPLHRRGVNVTMDYKNLPKTSIPEPSRLRLAKVGKRKQQKVLVASDGIYALWTPKECWSLPANCKTPEQIREWFEKRVKYRWSVNNKFKDGRIQFQCPQHAGRVKTTAKTKGKRRQPAKNDLKLVLDEEHTRCCAGSVTLTVEELDRYQQIPYGTTAYWHSYSRRNQIENSYSILRDRNGLTPHYCKARGLGAHRMAVLALCVANNLHFARKDPEAADPSAATNAGCYSNAGCLCHRSNGTGDGIDVDIDAGLDELVRAPP